MCECVDGDKSQTRCKNDLPELHCWPKRIMGWKTGLIGAPSRFPQALPGVPALARAADTGISRLARPARLARRLGEGPVLFFFVSRCQPSQSRLPRPRSRNTFRVICGSETSTERHSDVLQVFWYLELLVHIAVCSTQMPQYTFVSTGNLREALHSAPKVHSATGRLK